MRKHLDHAMMALGAMSAIATVLATTGWLEWVSRGLLAGVLAYLIFMVLHYRRTMEQVPPPEVIFSGPYKTIHADPADFDWICQTAERVYTGIDVIPKQQMLAWFEANPTGFYVIQDAGKRLCGNLDILPLRPDLLKLFIEGKIIERDLDGSSLYTPDEHTKIRDLYVESFVTVSRGRAGNAWAAYSCLMKVDVLVGQMCDPGQIQHVYAIAASKSGRRLVDHLGFSLAAPPNTRKDNHDLYWVRFQDLITNLSRAAGEGEKKKFLDLLTASDADSTL